MWEDFKAWCISTARAIGGAAVSAYNYVASKVERAARIVANNPAVREAFRLVVDQAIKKGVAAATVFLNSALPGMGAVFTVSIKILLDFIFAEPEAATA